MVLTDNDFSGGRERRVMNRPHTSPQSPALTKFLRLVVYTAIAMLTIFQSTSSADAKNYFKSADYYSEGQELAGRWHGKGAARLGLWGAIEEKDWDALCDNQHPATGQTLTARRKRDRRVGYDFTFSVPKSVSLLYGLTGDERVLEAFRESVNETMGEIEREMKTRVRKGGQDKDRITGEMVWGEYVHFTSRPVDGIPDPQLHAHCFVFNGTFDEKEGRWKAGQFADIKRDGKYWEAKCHSRVAWRMANLGLGIAREKKGWQIDGFSRATLDNFSRRTALIEKKAADLGITDPAEKASLGGKTREKKQKHLSMKELRREWQSRLTDAENADFARVRDQIEARSIPENIRGVEDAAALAVDHCFERKSVVPERALQAEALKRSVGAAGPDTVEDAVRRQDVIVGLKDGRRMASTRKVLEEEQAMIDFARQGRGACEPLGNGPHEFNRDWLNGEQRKAVEHVLDSRNRVIVIKGAAGTGKTTMMQEAVQAIESHGRKVFVFAPSASASRDVLRNEAGFAEADTVAMLLNDSKMQERVRGQVIWIDEAGLMGTKTMAQVFALADRAEARVILQGDRKQHGSVERGDALRLLETDAGLVPAEIKDIRRQKGAYKQVIKALSDGQTEVGFNQLDQLGWINEFDDEGRYSAIAGDYVKVVNGGESALVVAPTHAEIERVTKEIRTELRKQKDLKGEEKTFTVFVNANLTEAERRDPVSYSRGHTLVFHQNAQGYGKGRRIEVGKGELPLKFADRFTVFRSKELLLSRGDKIRITHNGKTLDGKHRLNNGAIFTVKNFTEAGNIRLTNGWTIDRDFGHLAHGYAVTSHQSQSKTVDHVLVAESSHSFAAASQEQWYVSLSRGRKRATVYTDNKEALLDAVKHSDDRLTATELVSGREYREHVLAVQRMEQAREREAGRDGRDREGMTYER